MEAVFGIALAVWIWLLLDGKSQATVAPSGVEPSSPAPATGNDALDNFLQAIFQKEGGRPGDRNVVNNNPGNLRKGIGMTGKAGGYATFADQGDGWDALNAQVQKWLANHPDWDFYDFFDYYLRGSTTAHSVDDQGDSDAYAEYVANFGGWNPSQTVSSALGA
jgi:hypothetical protein